MKSIVPDAATGGVLKKVVLKNFAKFTGKHLASRPATLLKKKLWVSQNTFEQLLSVDLLKSVFLNFSKRSTGALSLY